MNDRKSDTAPASIEVQGDEVPMVARVTTFQGPPDRIDEAARDLRERAVPGARQMPGYRGGFWMVDRESGKWLAVHLWESEEALRSSEAIVEQRRGEARDQMDVVSETVERYEVIAQA